MNDKKLERDWTVAPGAILDEWRTEQGLSVTDAAITCGLSRHQFEQLVDGKARITRLVAALLEGGTKISARMWLNLERGYREDLRAGRVDSTRST